MSSTNVTPRKGKEPAEKAERLHVSIHGRPVGTLTLTSGRLCAFQYDSAWLQDGYSISPFELPLKAGVMIARSSPFEGGFGVFDDSLPDGWGMLILDRFLRKKGIDPNSLSILARLAIVGKSGRGALEFYPEAEVVNTNLGFVDFEALAAEAKRILQSDSYSGKGIEEFQLRGGSPGGARPKIFTVYDSREWLVKFPARQDPVDIGKIEYRFSCLARECGVEMPETRLFEDKFFATERFDRSDGRKLHVVSMAGLLNADYRVPSIDYNHIFQVARVLTMSTDELWKVFRLMVINFLIGNKDDHAKNFAFLNREGKWHLAPGFDLLPSDGMNGFHTTSFNDKISPEPSDLVDIAVKAGLDRLEADKVLQEMSATVRRHS